MPEIKPENRLCWFCEYFIYTPAELDYSEVTPGSDFDMTCLKRHWEFSAFDTSQEEFGKMLMSARECSDFIPLANLK